MEKHLSEEVFIGLANEVFLTITNAASLTETKKGGGTFEDIRRILDYSKDERYVQLYD